MTDKKLYATFIAIIWNVNFTWYCYWYIDSVWKCRNFFAIYKMILSECWTDLYTVARRSTKFDSLDGERPPVHRCAVRYDSWLVLRVSARVRTPEQLFVHWCGPVDRVHRCFCLIYHVYLTLSNIYIIIAGCHRSSFYCGYGGGVTTTSIDLSSPTNDTLVGSRVSTLISFLVHQNEHRHEIGSSNSRRSLISLIIIHDSSSHSSCDSATAATFE